MEIVKRHRLSYSNCDAGTHRLGWAQGAMLREIQSRGPGNLIYVTKFALLDVGSTDVEGVLAAVQLTIERHDALRTRYVHRDGQWLQEVLGSDEISVAEISTTSPHVDKAGVMALLGPLSPAPDEVPVRIAVLTFEGRPTGVYLAIHHASVDNLGAEIACQEIRRRALGLTTLTSSAWQPRHIAEFEASPAGRATAERSIDYHRARIRDLADFEMPPASRSVTALREQQLRSSSLVVAAQQISQRARVSALSVALAAYCVALSVKLRSDRFPLALTSGNRFNPKVQTSVAQVAQASSLTVDITGEIFEEYCRQINSSMLLAYRHGVYDPEMMAELYRDISVHSGKEVSFPFLANFHLATPLESLDEELRSNIRSQIESRLRVPPQELRLMQEHSVYCALNADDGLRFCTLALDVYDFSAQADVRLRTDSAFFSDADMRGMLLSTERLVIDVACSPAEVEMKHAVELCSTALQFST